MDSLPNDDSTPTAVITDQTAFQSYNDLLQLLADPIAYGAAIARCKKAIAAAQEGIAQVRAHIAKIPPVDERQAEHDAAIERWKAAKAAIEELKPRCDRINELRKGWEFIGEDDDVRRGFKAPMSSPSTKARAAIGLAPWQGVRGYGFGVNSPGDIEAREQAAVRAEQIATDRWRESTNVGGPAPYNPSQFRFDAIPLPTDISVRTPTKFSRRKHRRPRELK